MCPLRVLSKSKFIYLFPKEDSLFHPQSTEKANMKPQMLGLEQQETSVKARKINLRNILQVLSLCVLAGWSVGEIWKVTTDIIHLKVFPGLYLEIFRIQKRLCCVLSIEESMVTL